LSIYYHMPFQKGVVTPGSGRKGFEYEYNQLKTMKELLNKYLEVAQRILNDEDRPRDARKIQLLSSDMRAILNKLHASKTDVTSDGEKLPTPLLHVLHNASNQEDSEPQQEIEGGAGGNIS
jgi:hypothetical protein